MILQEIKLGTQGLNEDQQAIAAACVRESLLGDVRIDESDDNGDDGVHDDSNDSYI